jgi:hypothetical protein
MRLGHHSMLPQTPLRLLLGKNHFLLVFQAVSAEKAQFSSLNPEVT